MAAKECLVEGLAPLWIEGELSGTKISANGHAYFNLKDKDSVLPTVLWRSSMLRLRMKLEDGKKVRVFGRFDLWPAQARFQFYGERIEPLGLGDLLARLEALKAKLAAEGLFLPERKKKLPRWPQTIGVVTSRSGAAIHDICKVIANRMPSRILLAPATVQGKEAPGEIIAALKRLSSQPGVDVIILGRGGGSIEDLWAFNDEALVREVAASSIPIVSAVGHEVDITLCDLAADVRAATPSQAAELVVPDRRALMRNLADLEHRLGTATQRRLLHAHSALDRAKSRFGGATRRWLVAQNDELAAHQQRMLRAFRGRLREAAEKMRDLTSRLRREDPRARLIARSTALATLSERLREAMRRQLAADRTRWVGAARSLHALSPLAVLERGYAVIRDERGEVIRETTPLHVGDAIDIRQHRRVIRARVEAVK
jgi:exodeoxyribonuclease VII large subunit